MEKKTKNVTTKKKVTKKKKVERIELPTPEQIRKSRLEKRVKYLKNEKKKEARDAFYGLFLIFICTGLYYSLPSLESFVVREIMEAGTIFNFIYIVIKLVGAAGLFMFVACLFSSLTKTAELSDIKREEKELIL